MIVTTTVAAPSTVINKTVYLEIFMVDITKKTSICTKLVDILYV